MQYTGICDIYFMMSWFNGLLSTRIYTAFSSTSLQSLIKLLQCLPPLFCLSPVFICGFTYRKSCVCISLLLACYDFQHHSVSVFYALSHILFVYCCLF